MMWTLCSLLLMAVVTYAAPNHDSYECPQGFRPNDVGGCIDIDECQNPIIRCGIHANCFNTNGGYQCVCVPGYTKNAHGRCVDEDECDTQLDLCTINENCVNLIGSYQCFCKVGFRRKLDIGCVPIHADRNSNNNDDHDSYQCPEGFRPNDVGGCIDIDECQNPIIRCGTHANCFNINGGYQCVCVPGYTKNAHGHCVDEDECDTHSDLCTIYENCVNLIGSYQCFCKVRFRRKQDVGCVPIYADKNSNYSYDHPYYQYFARKSSKDHYKPNDHYEPKDHYEPEYHYEPKDYYEPKDHYEATDPYTDDEKY